MRNPVQGGLNIGTYNFHKDLKESKVVEKEVEIGLENHHGTVTLISGNSDYRFDLAVQFPKKGFEYSTLEIKNDLKSGQTGNVAIEFESRNKPSGIANTKADYYIHRLYNKDGTFEHHMISVNRIKRLIREEAYTKIVIGGDRGSRTKMYLFKKEFYISQCGKLKF